jgi:glutaredoxin
MKVVGVIVALVAALAGLAALTGLCLGCNLYKLSARLRGIRPGASRRIDLLEVGTSATGPLVVQFTHPLCTDCRAVESRLRNEGHELVTVDVSKQRALARKYNVAVVPAAFAVGQDGRIVARLA